MRLWRFYFYGFYSSAICLVHKNEIEIHRSMGQHNCYFVVLFIYKSCYTELEYNIVRPPQNDINPIFISLYARYTRFSI